MGCSNSKLHNLPAVSLCRDRCKFLAEALHHIHSLSSAHVAYLQSLDSLGSSLHRFLDQTPILHHNAGAGDDLKVKSPQAAAAAVERTSSTPDSHIHFDDSESDDDNASKTSSNSNSNIYHFEEPRHVIMESSSYNFYENRAVFFRSPPSSAAPPPPPATGLGWDILNLFDAYDRSDHLHVESMEVEVPVSTEEKRREKKEKKSAGEESAAEKKSAKEESAVEKKTEVNGEKERLLVKEAETAGSEKSKAVVDDIGREMQSLFEEAALSGRRVLVLIDAAKVRYLHNHGVTKEPISVADSVREEEGSGGCGGGGLSSTLTKFSMWEKKLYHEVKAEGKLRILYAQKWRELKQLDGSSKNDAEAKKAESVRNLIITVSAKLKIAFHVIDKVSMTLNSLRDQELWPLINQLIHGFQEMWQTMLTCHSRQHKLVEELLKTLDGDSIKSEWTFLDGNRHLEESLKLRSDLHRWSLSFGNWVNTQKRFTKSLNTWLLRCLEPQGEASSMSAPSVLVICSQWSKSLEMVSDKEVIEAGNGFLRAMEQHCMELMLQRAVAESREGKMKVEKKGLLLSSCGRNGAVGSDFCDGRNVSVQCCLKCTFEAVEKFGAVSFSVYQELCGNSALSSRNPSP